MRKELKGSEPDADPDFAEPVIGRRFAPTRWRLRPPPESMPAMGFLHRRELLGTGRALIGRLPGLVGHAVDGLAAFVLAHVSTLGVGFLLEPVGQAVAAESREIHQIDVLDIGAGAQMLDKAPEDGGFKFRSGFFINRHGRYSPFPEEISILSGAFSQ